jgi:SAM-dependent methyltransferase
MTVSKNPTDDSKLLWQEVHSRIPLHDIRLGNAAAAAYVSDAKMIAFMASRYKFVAKMIDRAKTALEVGCGDGFGAPMVAQSVGRLICTDINEATIADNATRLSVFKNIEFEYFDFRSDSFPVKVDAAYAVDVIEHIYPSEEELVIGNIARSISAHGVGLFGTPNKTAEVHASEYSRLGHVNLKDHNALRETLSRSFHNIFIFSMNDEVVHTGYYPMAHYLWALCVGPRQG